MEKILGNYTSQQYENFPLDCETLDYLQNNQHLAEMIGAIAGNKIILSGCVVSGQTRTPGYVFLKTTDFPQGEVLYFEGDDSSNTFAYLAKSAIAVVANADPYPNAYTKRTLKPGRGTEQYDWADFAYLTGKTNRELRTEVESLQEQVASLQPAPVGSIMIWPSSTIPSGWALCDGSSYSRSEYAQLFTVLGTTYGSNDESSFKIPDMQGLFVAGKGANGYNSLNQKGGQNTVALDVQEMPKHNHDTTTSVSDASVTTTSAGAHSHNIPTGPDTTSVATGAQKAGSSYAPFDSGSAGEHTHAIELKARGGLANGSTKAHENRPPYIVMNYIIKLK